MSEFLTQVSQFQFETGGSDDEFGFGLALILLAILGIMAGMGKGGRR